MKTGQVKQTQQITTFWPQLWVTTTVSKLLQNSKVNWPPPNTVRVSFTVWDITQRASCNERSASSRICWVAPRSTIEHASPRATPAQFTQPINASTSHGHCFSLTKSNKIAAMTQQTNVTTFATEKLSTLWSDDGRQTGEFDQSVLADHDFLNEVTSAEFYRLRHVKGWNDLTTYTRPHTHTAIITAIIQTSLG